MLKLNILIAKDEEDIRNLLRISLKDEGNQVFPACDGDRGDRAGTIHCQKYFELRGSEYKAVN